MHMIHIGRQTSLTLSSFHTLLDSPVMSTLPFQFNDPLEMSYQSYSQAFPIEIDAHHDFHVNTTYVSVHCLLILFSSSFNE
jgi:hypothetical protein